MTEAANTLDKDRHRAAVRHAGTRRVSAREEHQAATAELAACCRRARAAGLGVTEIAQLARLSRQGIYQLLDLTDERTSGRRGKTR